MVKFAVLGCGRIGRMHALNLARQPRAELAYVYDVTGDAAAATADATGARQAREVDEVLDAGDVEAVLIASSTATNRARRFALPTARSRACRPAKRSRSAEGDHG